MDATTTKHGKFNDPYALMLIIFALFIITALICDSPEQIHIGMLKIMYSSSVLLTDYIYVGGIGAALINSALVGTLSIFMLKKSNVRPSGSIIMALWLTAGFAMFGKNLLNMMPITFGVYLYSRYRKEPFTNFVIPAFLAATLSPVVSGIGYSGLANPFLSNLFGFLLGVLAGFIFPVVSSFTMRVHGGYDLYNMGFAGGLISTFLVACLSSLGINIETQLFWSSGNNLPLAILLYLVFAVLICAGIVYGGGLEAVKKYAEISHRSGRLVTDLYALSGPRVFLNMGVTGAFVTTIMLVLQCDLNGPTLGGIFTVVGFSAFGKHPFNITPPLIGAIISTNVNMWDPTAPFNTLAILFSTGLAPISGQFGWIWGLLAGFLQVSIVNHIGFLNSGLNLYNNGYAAGFVALLLVPLAVAFRKDEVE